jgi:2-polyprenyl-3-methyl-5-hydroxy-6-metoxy-1,4-benzoquinol methylase
MKCIFCQSQTRFLFSSRDQVITENSLEYRLHWCEACDFGRLQGDFTPEQISRFYTDGYYTHGDPGGKPDRMPLLDHFRFHLACKLDNGIQFSPDELPRLKTVCDIGCGSGSTLEAFRARNYQTFGVEPDPLARSVASRSGVIFNGTAEALPEDISDRKFDVVMMSHVLEHCIDPKAAVRNAKRILNHDGTLVIEVPNNTALGFAKFRACWPWTDIPRHLSFFTENSLRSLLSDNDLTVCKVSYVGYARQFSPWWLRCIDASGIGAWSFLARTAFASPKAKYDSIRVHAFHSWIAS